jgi:CheY-like chemotaxis protein
MKSILVVDDDPMVSRTVKRMLTGEEWDVHLAQDGLDALDQVARLSPDLIITDIIMPNMEGLEVILALRKIDPTIPVIAVSGGGALQDHDYLDFAAKLGAVATLTKPFRREELLRVVREALNEKGIRRNMFGR